MATILMIEDDELIAEPVCQELTDAGFDVLLAGDGEKGLELALRENPDLVLLDIMLPVLDGWEVCRRLRKRSPVPILMLTALTDEIDRVLGLEIGADDYLTKPFSSRELIARVRANLRRVALDQPSEPQLQEISIGDIRLNLETRRVFNGDEELTLRFKEFELLSLLMARAGQAVSRAELFDEVWGTDWLGDTRTLDVHIRWLREKVEDDPSNPHYVQTVRGYGYRFWQPNEDGA